MTASRIRRSGAVVLREMVKPAERGRIEIDFAKPSVGDALACVRMWPLGSRTDNPRAGDSILPLAASPRRPVAAARKSVLHRLRESG